MKTYSPKLAEIENKWYVVDAKDVVLGRLAVILANRIRGKHKPTFAPHMDCGDNIVVINADKVKLTGNKKAQGKFIWHTNHPGGIKEKSWADILDGKHPERLISKAVERMISKGVLRRNQMRRLHIYAGESHPHEAQAPETLDVSVFNAKNKR
ncbi:MAG: 50S ribosomal protein L13 [Alphaproteobacteria bacterium]|nr:50S ribosomal protein L13 [Alphaproteobacteria bacterium]